MKKLLGIIGFLAIVLLLTTGIVLYARGYRPNLKERSLQATGIVSIKSKPSGAAVFINNEQKGETDLDITDLSPGKYKVKISKEGFSVWEKEIVVKKETVNQIEAVLFPLAPSLKALTFTGVTKPLVSPAGNKVVFGLTQPAGKAGIWTLSLSDSPLPSFFSKDLNQLVSDTKEFAFSSAEFEFSPDGKQLLVKLPSQPIFFLVDAAKKNENPKEVTLDIEKVREEWSKKRSSDQASRLKALGKQAESTAAGLSNLVFSPDKNSFFGRRTDGSLVLYDGKSESDGKKEPQIFNLPVAERSFWYPDSQHVILVNKNIISIVGSDGTNNVPIYTSGFDPSFLATWPDGSKLIVATNLNSSGGNLPNLYAIELR